MFFKTGKRKKRTLQCAAEDCKEKQKMQSIHLNSFFSCMLTTVISMDNHIHLFKIAHLLLVEFHWGGSCLWPRGSPCPGRCIGLRASCHTQTGPEVKSCAGSFSNSKAVVFRKFGDGLSTGNRRGVLHQKPPILLKAEAVELLSIHIFSLSRLLLLSLFHSFFSTQSWWIFPLQKTAYCISLLKVAVGYLFSPTAEGFYLG